MTFLESGTFGFGGSVFPLTSSNTNTLLRDADPAMYYAIEYFRAVLLHHLDARFIVEANAVNLKNVTHVVAATCWFDPAQYLKEGQFQMPLLSVWRENADWINRTVAKRHVESMWNVAYSLPPLALNQQSLRPILNAVARVLDNRTEQGFDPNVLGGQKVFALSGIESIEFRSEKQGAWQAIDGAVFPAVAMTVMVKERVENVSGAFGPFLGIDTAEDLQPVGGVVVSDFVDFITDTT